jgi:CBS domain-containing protein
MSERPETSAARTAYLLDGRRVTIADLIDASLLVPGAALRFRRPHKGKTHKAVITSAGTIELEGGQDFRSPSRAAAVAADMRAVDGWHAWTVTSSGASLDSLRQELLGRAAAETLRRTNGGPEPAPASQRRFEQLREARARADAKDPVEISVRQLLALWDARARGIRINERIEADLANHGLATWPSFRKVTIDATVHLITATQDAEATGSVPSDVDDSEDLDTGLTVGNLPSALSGVVSIPPTATFDQAITLMALNGYSQLAVLSGSHSLRGAVTWQSIAYARHGNPDASFSDAIVPPHEARYDQYLIDVLPALETWDFLFVRDEKNAVAGIVTTADVVRAYGELATPFFLIGELDQVLRWLIARTFTLEEVIALCDPDGRRPIRAFDDLDMGDYQRVLEHPALWARLRWPLDRVTFIKRLDELREVRNNVTHFNPDPLPDNTVEKLQYILKLVRDFGGPGGAH